MKRLMIVLAVVSFFRSTAFAQMGMDHGNGMMDGGWGWGMNSGWFLVIIIAILAIVGIVYIIKRK
jgi:uncharacterized membrane protein